MKGPFTLSFFTVTPKNTVIQHPSFETQYQSLEDARQAAREALKLFPHVTYAGIYHREPMGSPKEVERVGRKL
jgi:hypothetical protein